MSTKLKQDPLSVCNRLLGTRVANLGRPTGIVPNSLRFFQTPIAPTAVVIAMPVVGLHGALRQQRETRERRERREDQDERKDGTAPQNGNSGWKGTACLAGPRPGKATIIHCGPDAP